MAEPSDKRHAKKAQSRTDRAGGSPASGVVRADELYRLTELRRRLGWGPHAVRQARGAGLRLIKFGRERFVLGSDVLAFFRTLGDRQDDTARGSNGEGQR